MPRLSNRLKSWNAFLDWYARDAGYWYFPKGRAADKVAGQTLRYMGYVRSEMLERKGQKVRGIILSRQTDNKLKMAIAGMGAKSNPINTKTFNVSITVGD